MADDVQVQSDVTITGANARTLHLKTTKENNRTNK